MKFMEKNLPLRTDSLFNFITSALNNLIFTPIRLLQEVSKKSVYLKRKQLDTLLFSAVMVGIGLTITTAVLKIFLKNFNILSGKFPLVLLVIGDIILITLYAFFSSSNLIIYDTLSSNKVKGELGINRQNTTVSQTPVEDTVNINKSTTETKESVNNSVSEDTELVSVTEEDIQMIQNWAKENDYFKAKPNPEIIGSAEIKQYQNRLKDGIEQLENFKNDTLKFSAAELELLQQKLDSVTPPGKFINEDYVKRLNLLKQTDEMDTLDNDIVEVPESFKLVL